MISYPIVCEGCEWAATCVNVKEQYVRKVCCKSKEITPCNNIKICPSSGLFIYNKERISI